MYNLLATIKFFLFTCSKPSTHDVSLVSFQLLLISSNLPNRGRKGCKRLPRCALEVPVLMPQCVTWSLPGAAVCGSLGHHPQWGWTAASVKKPPIEGAEMHTHFLRCFFSCIFPETILVVFRGAEQAACPSRGPHLWREPALVPPFRATILQR